MLQYDILTLFPAMFEPVFQAGIVRRAVEAGLVGISCHDLRAFGVGRHRVTDDALDEFSSPGCDWYLRPPGRL